MNNYSVIFLCDEIRRLKNLKFEDCLKIEKDLEKIITKCNNPNTLKIICEGLFEVDRIKEALEVAESILKMNPNDKDALFLKSQAFEELGYQSEARRIANKLLEIDPNNMKFWHWKIILTYRDGRLKEVIKMCKQGLKIINERLRMSKNTNKIELIRYKLEFLKYLKVLIEEGKEEFIKTLETFKNLANNNIKLLNNLLRFLRKHDYINKALVYEKLHKIDPTNPWYLLNLHIVYHELQDFEKAKKCLKRAKETTEELLKKYPKSSILWRILAEIHLEEEYKDLNKALEYANKAVELNPYCAENWETLAHIYEKLGQPDKALERIDKALKLRPDDFTLWFKRGKYLKTLSRYREAIEAYEMVRKLVPGTIWSDFARNNIIDIKKKMYKFYLSREEILGYITVFLMMGCSYYFLHQFYLHGDFSLLFAGILLLCLVVAGFIMLLKIYKSS